MDLDALTIIGEMLAGLALFFETNGVKNKWGQSQVPELADICERILLT